MPTYVDRRTIIGSVIVYVFIVLVYTLIILGGGGGGGPVLSFFYDGDVGCVCLCMHIVLA